MDHGEARAWCGRLLVSEGGQGSVLRSPRAPVHTERGSARSERARRRRTDAVELLTEGGEDTSGDGATGLEMGHEWVENMWDIAVVVVGGLKRREGERSGRGAEKKWPASMAIKAGGFRIDSGIREGY